MIRRKLSQAAAWSAKTIRHFLADPLQMIGLAGVVMGGLVVAIGVILTFAMFSPTLAASALAAVIAPLLQNIALTMLAIIAVVIMVMLGFKDFRIAAMGAEVSATMAKEASLEAADALEKVGEALTPDDPS